MTFKPEGMGCAPIARHSDDSLLAAGLLLARKQPFESACAEISKCSIFKILNNEKDFKNNEFNAELRSVSCRSYGDLPSV